MHISEKTLRKIDKDYVEMLRNLPPEIRPVMLFVTVKLDELEFSLADIQKTTEEIDIQQKNLGAKVTLIRQDVLRPDQTKSELQEEVKKIEHQLAVNTFDWKLNVKETKKLKKTHVLLSKAWKIILAERKKAQFETLSSRQQKQFYKKIWQKIETELPELFERAREIEKSNAELSSLVSKLEARR